MRKKARLVGRTEEWVGGGVQHTVGTSHGAHVSKLSASGGDKKKQTQTQHHSYKEANVKYSELPPQKMNNLTHHHERKCVQESGLHLVNFQLCLLSPLRVSST